MHLERIIIDVNSKKMYAQTDQKLNYESRHEETKFVFDTDTNIVYWKFYESREAGFMCPLLGEHGRPCCFENGEFKEISSFTMSI